MQARGPGNPRGWPVDHGPAVLQLPLLFRIPAVPPPGVSSDPGPASLGMRANTPSEEVLSPTRVWSVLHLHET